uniref:DUF2634 domain-containing protein n=1 Tax=Paenibacillus xylanexedens TaxID=528191 RepID=UPI001C92C5F7
GMEWCWEGMGGRWMVESEVERWIGEGLVRDDGISDVRELEFVEEGEGVGVCFRVERDFGRLREEREVKMNV